MTDPPKKVKIDLSRLKSRSLFLSKATTVKKRSPTNSKDDDCQIITSEPPHKKSTTIVKLSPTVNAPKAEQLKKFGPNRKLQIIHNERGTSISHSKNLEPGTRLDVIDKFGNVVGTKLITSRTRRGRKPKDHALLAKQSVTGIINQLPTFSPDQLEGKHKTSVFKLEHRKAILTGLSKLKLENHSGMDCVDQNLKNKWFEACEWPENDPMNRDLFDLYIEKMHKRARCYALSSIYPKKITQFWKKLADFIGEDAGFEIANKYYTEILDEHKEKAAKPTAQGLKKIGDTDKVVYGTIELHDAATAGGVEWAKIYEYWAKLSIPDSELPELSPKEASIVISLYHKRCQQVKSFFRDESKPQARNLQAALLQRAYYLNAGYMDYKYNTIFEARPEVLQSKDDKNVWRTVEEAVQANSNNPSAFNHEQEKVNISGKHFNYTVHKKQSEFPNTGTPKQKLEHHWWPSNIFAMNVNSWNKDIKNFLPDIIIDD